MEGLKTRADAVAARLNRLKERYQKKRKLAAWALGSAGLAKLSAVDFSVALSEGLVTARCRHYVDVLEELFVRRLQVVARDSAQPDARIDVGVNERARRQKIDPAKGTSSGSSVLPTPGSAACDGEDELVHAQLGATDTSASGRLR